MLAALMHVKVTCTIRVRQHWYTRPLPETFCHISTCLQAAHRERYSTDLFSMSKISFTLRSYTAPPINNALRHTTQPEDIIPCMPDSFGTGQPNNSLKYIMSTHHVAIHTCGTSHLHTHILRIKATLFYTVYQQQYYISTTQAVHAPATTNQGARAQSLWK